MNKIEKIMDIKVKLNEDNDKIMICFEKNEDNGKNNKNHFVKIRKIHGNNFHIEFLGIDENGCEIYKGEKDSWKNFVEYLFWLYEKCGILNFKNGVNNNE